MLSNLDIVCLFKGFVVRCIVLSGSDRKKLREFEEKFVLFIEDKYDNMLVINVLKEEIEVFKVKIV